jgi:hypothetical protein
MCERVSSNLEHYFNTVNYKHIKRIISAADVWMQRLVELEASESCLVIETN